MPTTLRVLGQAFPSATVETALYTCGVVSAVISTLVVCNTSLSTPDTFSVRICVGGAADTNMQLIFSLATIPAGTMLPITIGITIASGDVIKVLSTNGTTAFNCFGQENS